jgi:hypothetical protein
LQLPVSVVHTGERSLGRHQARLRRIVGSLQFGDLRRERLERLVRDIDRGLVEGDLPLDLAEARTCFGESSSRDGRGEHERDRHRAQQRKAGADDRGDGARVP